MHTHITIVLDSSGSMRQIEEDTKGGFNSFLEDQKDEDGTADVTLIEFNTQVEEVYHGRSIENAPELDDDNYTPGGRTALHDAINQAIDRTEDWFEPSSHSVQADNVVVVVLTDGRENASETPQDTVRDKVEAKQDEGWEFLFIGAEEDAALQATGLGVGVGHTLTMSATGAGTTQAFSSTSQQVSRLRSTGSLSGFDDEDREKQKQAR